MFVSIWIIVVAVVLIIILAIAPIFMVFYLRRNTKKMDVYHESEMEQLRLLRNNGSNTVTINGSGSLTKQEFAKRSEEKIVNVATAIGVSFVSVYLIESIPSIIENYVPKESEHVKNMLFIFRDILGVIVIIFLIWHLVVVLIRIKESIQDINRRCEIMILNILSGWCIIPLMLFNASIILLMLYPDLIKRETSYIEKIILEIIILFILVASYCISRQKN